MERAAPYEVSDRMRCFFHLVKGSVVLTDDTGVDAADLVTAVTQILMTLRDLRTRDPAAEDDWQGWRLDIVDRTGDVLSTISLDEPTEGIDISQQRRQYA